MNDNNENQSVEDDYVIQKSKCHSCFIHWCVNSSGGGLWMSHGVVCVCFSEYIQRYATEEALKEQEEGGGDSSSESSMSDFSEDEAQDMEL